MNLNAITKHYEKLTTVERFKLMNAARTRGDKSELFALRDSAQKKIWRVMTLRGLSDAFDFLVMWYALTMLELESMYWVLIALGDDPDEIKMPGDSTWSGILENIQRRALAYDDAWRAVCNDYNVNAGELLEGLPGVLTIDYFLQTLREWQTIRPVEYDTTPYINDLRAVVDHYRKQWE